MKVLFLDFDGVLNSVKWSETNPPGLIYRSSKDLDPACVHLLSKYLLKNKDINVVVCSDWRKLHDLEYIKKELSTFSFPVEKIIGITPVVHNKIREFEVREYLKKHPEVTSFVCLDNDAHFGSLNEKHLVQTDERVGLQVKDFTLLDKLYKDQNGST